MKTSISTKTALKVAKQVSKQKVMTITDLALLALSNAYLKKLLILRQYEKQEQRRQAFLRSL